jgi:hypothetical protein
MMTPFRLRILAQTLPFLLLTPGLALAQNAPTRGQAAAALNQPAKPGAQQYTRQQIDQLVAPVALYPDQVLSQVLMASTYPQQVVEAAQWLQDHKDLQGDALAQALEPLQWDPGVKALCAFPQVVQMMAEHIEWTQALGVAFTTQQTEVMTRVQALRQLAMKSGQLNKVKHLAARQQGEVIVITSDEPDKVYVPVYNPTVVYGEWPDREFPPVFLPPPQGLVAETIEPGLELSVGYTVVRPLWGWSELDWRSRRITVNTTEYTRISRNVAAGPGNVWRHSGPILLVSPGTVSRTTSVTTTNVPAGTVLPARAAAVTVLPQRAAADPARIKTQTTTNQTGGTQPGQARSGSSQPEQNQTRTNEPNATQPAQGQATTSREPSRASGSERSRSGSTASPTAPAPDQQPRHPEARQWNREKGEARPSEAFGPRERERERANMPGGSQPQPGAQERAGSSAAPSERPQMRAPERNEGAAIPGQHEQRMRSPEQGSSTAPAEQQRPAARAPEQGVAQPPAGPQAPGATAPEQQHQQRRPGPEAGQGSSTPPAGGQPQAAPQRPHEPAGARPPGRGDDNEKNEKKER